MMEDLKGICDMHVHSAPDVIPRTYDDFQLADAAVKVGARAIMLKSHHGSTVTRAYMCNRYIAEKYGDTTDLTMYGGVVLNRDVGGLNPKAVETAIQMGGREVWLPTIDAENDRKKEGKPGGMTVLTDSGELKPEVLRIMEMVAKAGIVLSTGHISPKEALAVGKAAKEMGLTRLVVTHPEFWIVGYTLEEEKELMNEYGMVMERCYKQPLMDHSWKDNCETNLEAIKALGAEHTMIDTDSGQPVNPPWEKGFQHCVQYMADHGISHAAIHHMTRDIPRWLLGIDKELTPYKE